MDFYNLLLGDVLLGMMKQVHEDALSSILIVWLSKFMEYAAITITVRNKVS